MTGFLHGQLASGAGRIDTHSLAGGGIRGDPRLWSFLAGGGGTASGRRGGRRGADQPNRARPSARPPPALRRIVRPAGAGRGRPRPTSRRFLPPAARPTESRSRRLGESASGGSAVGDRQAADVGASVEVDVDAPVEAGQAAAVRLLPERPSGAAPVGR